MAVLNGTGRRCRVVVMLIISLDEAPPMTRRGISTLDFRVPLDRSVSLFAFLACQLAYRLIGRRRDPRRYPREFPVIGGLLRSPSIFHFENRFGPTANGKLVSDESKRKVYNGGKDT